MGRVSKPKLLFAFCSSSYESFCKNENEMNRLSALVDHDWLSLDDNRDRKSSDFLRHGPCDDPASRKLLKEALADIDALVIHDGCPKIDADMLNYAPRLKFICDVEGDRFGYRFNLQDCWAAGVRTIDSNHGVSYPVAEWALGLILISLRNAGSFFRQQIAPPADSGSPQDRKKIRDLFGKSVGLIGGGHIAQRLIRFLEPFECEVVVHDPYLPKMIANAMNFTLTSLDVAMQQDVIVVLVPITPKTKGMIGINQLKLVKPGAVFVNVSRGAVVDTNALITRLKVGDITAGLDVFDPEPIPANHPIKSLTNVFLSPHIAAHGASKITNFSLMLDDLERHLLGHETLFDLTEQTQANRAGNPPIRNGS
jgi:phosphoglycerate dehydrogenase-like enzyme